MQPATWSCNKGLATKDKWHYYLHRHFTLTDIIYHHLLFFFFSFSLCSVHMLFVKVCTGEMFVTNLIQNIVMIGHYCFLIFFVSYYCFLISSNDFLSLILLIYYQYFFKFQQRDMTRGKLYEMIEGWISTTYPNNSPEHQQNLMVNTNTKKPAQHTKTHARLKKKSNFKFICRSLKGKKLFTRNKIKICIYRYQRFFMPIKHYASIHQS